ncbi:MAG TPA: HPr-rel-A system PqqD family peptide chaperone [Sedimenticola thiotaurini]|uniref:HPr-rel-A system PqqD family peptide chaperone n=1 Tax=Sedimenticola thiotaurini TaxID=1543721 RepID=A0A831RND8_9GAMM|nr:HPr-rel-A system PqqD family peptide chaperone [Sedimenticola thiotaurini]
MEYPAWQTPPFSRIELREYDTEVVVLDTGSGNTLALDPIAAAVLSWLSQGPQNHDRLMAQISHSFDIPADDSLRSYLESLLDSLQQQNLIQPTSE